MKIAILFGTQTGNADMLADDILTHLEDDHEVTCSDLADTSPAELDQSVFHVFVCSTFGAGELPASAEAFGKELASGTHRLTSLRFAMFGLGDMSYEATFAFGSKTLAELLTRSGATQIGPRQTHDARGDDMPEDIALPWIDAILETVQETPSGVDA